MRYLLNLHLYKIIMFACVLLGSVFSFAINNRTTYQAKIIKPDGYALEAISVNFKFTVLDPAASCVLYSEEYTAVNMQNSGGLIFFSLGAGNRIYPASGSTTFESVMDNSVVSLPCQTPGIYTPTAADNRKIVMQFNDGYGWQTLPAMAINSVPYAMYAGKSDNAIKLNGKADTAFVEYSSLASLTCNPATEAIAFNGVSFSCIPVGASSPTSATIIAALGYTPANPASLSTSYTTTASYSAVVATVGGLSTSLTAISGNVSALTAAVSGITSSQWLTSGSTIAYNSGNVGIGTTNPTAKLHVGVAPIASATRGTLSLGAGSFNGSTAGFFAGSALGTSLAINEVSGFAGNLVDLQANGVSKFRIAGDGNINLGTTAYTTRSIWLTTGNQAKLELNAGGVGQETQAARLMMGGHNGFGANFHVYFGSSATNTNGDFRIYDYDGSTTATERFRIDNAGKVGIGTTTPVTKLDVSGGVRIGMESATCAAIFAGTLRYNGANVEYCNGTIWSAFGVAGAGITSLNGSSSGTQTFVTGITGTVFNISSSNGAHTFNIPLAASSSVTAGLLSNADYTTFMGKITSSSAAITQVLGYVPASATALGNYLVKTNNLSDLVSSASARTNLGLGSFATASSIDLGSASATGTLAEARLQSFANVTSGTQYTKVTVDGKGRVISGAQLALSDVTTALGYTPANSSLARVATTANIALTGLQTIDTISLAAGERVLVKNQSLQRENGLYITAAGAWTRAPDLDTWAELYGLEVYVVEGNVNQGMAYMANASNVNGILNTTSFEWTTRGSNYWNTNVAFGVTALIKNSSGFDNAAFGGFTLPALTTGSENTAIGNYSLEDLTTGNQNTAIGAAAMAGITSGSQNTSLGYRTLTSVSNGQGNIAIGANAGWLITSGSHNVVIGSNTGASIATSSNNILLSDGAGNERMRVDASGNFGIGTTTPTAKLDVSGTITMSSSSEGVSTYVNTGTSYTIANTSLNIRRLTLTGNATVTLPVYAPSGTKMFTLTVFVKQDGVGSRTLNFLGTGADAIKWDSGVAPSISTAINKITILQFTKPSDEAVWYGSKVWQED